MNCTLSASSTVLRVGNVSLTRGKDVMGFTSLKEEKSTTKKYYLHESTAKYSEAKVKIFKELCYSV